MSGSVDFYFIYVSLSNGVFNKRILEVSCFKPLTSALTDALMSREEAPILN